MLFKSQSVAKLVLAALVGIASTSGYFAKEWHGQRVAAQGKLVSSQRATADAKKANEELTRVLTPGEPQMVMQDAMTGLMLDVYNLRLKHGVTVGSVAPGKFSGTGGVAQLDALSDVVPGTDVNSTRLDIRGSYSDYLGLLAYIKELQQHAVSVVHLRVQEQSFELGLRVYAVNPTNPT